MGVGGPDNTAVEFEGRWQEFFPVAMTNTLLTFATLGIYRFWGLTRERKYLWSKTRFIDDHISWHGTGKELFFGFIGGFVLVALPLFLLQFGSQAAILRGQVALGGALTLLMFTYLMALAGFAVFRGLRYRLSRTYWHGIRGGTDSQGIGFAGAYFLKMYLIPLLIFAAVAALVAGLDWVSGGVTVGKMVKGPLIAFAFLAYALAGFVYPWATTTLWNQRWSQMSFGPHVFQSDAHWRQLLKRYLICIMAPLVVVGLLIAGMANSGVMGGKPDASAAANVGASAFLLVVIFYFVLPLLALAYYAAYLRSVTDSLRISSLGFSFGARTKHWVLLFLGNYGLSLLALLVASLLAAITGSLGLLTSLGEAAERGQFGIGSFLDAGRLVLLVLSFLIPFSLVAPFIRYRSWAFYVRHMEAEGEITLTDMTQSATRAPKQGEGLLDALDMGAI